MIYSETTKVIKGTKVVINGEIKPATLIIKDGILIDIKEYDYEIPCDWEILAEYDDQSDMVIMGGLVDSHVHVNEPGRTEWEGFVTATSAAAAGGVTTIIDMPLNSAPVTTSYENLLAKIESMNGKLRVDVGLLGGIIPNNSHEIKRMVLDGGVVGFKSFLVHSGIDEFPHVGEADIQMAMTYMGDLKENGVVMMFHAEIGEPIDEACERLRQENADPKEYNTFLQSRPRESENIAIDRIIDLSKKNNISTHIVHLSSSDAIQALHQAAHDGVPITAETTFHYLFFESENVPYGNTLYKCCPPVRESENKDLLWKALERGDINIVVSDHSPCTVNLKLLDEGDFMRAWGGICSLQLGLSIVWTEAKKRNIPLTKLSEWMCDAPAKLVNINDQKGSIKVGRDADFVIWNPNHKYTVSQETMMVKNKFSPYNQFELYGRVHQTVLRGNLIYTDGDVSVDQILGKRIVPTKIHTRPTYSHPYLPNIQLLNSLDQQSFTDCLTLLFEPAQPLSDLLYSSRPYKSYEDLLDKATQFIRDLDGQDQLLVINAHPRIGINPSEVQQMSSLSFKEQGCDKEVPDGADTSALDQVYKSLEELNEKYESKYGFKFVTFVNGRSKSDIIPIFKERLESSTKEKELSLGLSEMMLIAKSRLSKLSH